MSSCLKINEMFETIQGEGSYTGCPSIFIRLQGCPVGCSWCDTKHTWEVDPDLAIPAQQVLNKSEEDACYFETTVTELLSIFKQQGYCAKHIVITGGEPAMYDLVEITRELIEKGFSVQLETSGTFEIKVHPDVWVTLSPKVNMKGGYQVLDQALQRANEVKHPVAMQKHITELDALLSRGMVDKQVLVYLQPISQGKRATELAIQTCIKRNWRLSVQTHKYIGID